MCFFITKRRAFTLFLMFVFLASNVAEQRFISEATLFNSLPPRGTLAACLVQRWLRSRRKETAQLKSIYCFIISLSPSTASGPPPSQMEAQIVQRKKRGKFNFPLNVCFSDTHHRYAEPLPLEKPRFVRFQNKKRENLISLLLFVFVASNVAKQRFIAKLLH